MKDKVVKARPVKRMKAAPARGLEKYSGVLTDKQLREYRAALEMAWDIPARALGWKSNKELVLLGLSMGITFTGAVVVKFIRQQEGGQWG